MKTMTTETVEKEVVEDILCDVCGKSCRDSAGINFEVATLSEKWGFGSRKDCEHHECHLCEDCYDKVRAYIEGTLGGKVRVNEYSIIG